MPKPEDESWNPAAPESSDAGGWDSRDEGNVTDTQMPTGSYEIPAARRTPAGSLPAESGSAETARAPWEGPAATMVRPTNDLAPGTVLGKYRIVRRLKVGGMGAVYEALHVDIGRPVALKTMSPQLAADQKAVARFMREAASLSRLEHPNVVSVTDFGTDRGTTYLVMELLRGEDLSAGIKRASGMVDPVFMADIMLGICAGVFAAHEAGMVHRDLKPANIFLSRSSLGETTPKVLDFGVSKMIGDESTGLTSTGIVMGTIHYLAPEQVGAKGVDARSDQYGLGVILYEALLGRLPHVGASVYVLMRSINEGKAPPPRSLRPELSQEMEALIMRAMALRPADRFESVFELGRALLPLASGKSRVVWADYYEPGSSPSTEELSARNLIFDSGSHSGSGASRRNERDSGGRVAGGKSDATLARSTPAASTVAAVDFSQDTPVDPRLEPEDLLPADDPESPRRNQEPVRAARPSSSAQGRPARPRARGTLTRLAVLLACGGVASAGLFLFFSPPLRDHLLEQVTDFLHRQAAPVVDLAKAPRETAPRPATPAEVVPAIEAAPKTEPAPPVVDRDPPVTAAPKAVKKRALTTSAARAKKRRLPSNQPLKEAPFLEHLRQTQKELWWQEQQKQQQQQQQQQQPTQPQQPYPPPAYPAQAAPSYPPPVNPAPSPPPAQPGQ